MNALSAPHLPPIRLIYRNHRGEVAVRSIVPLSIRHGSTQWHPDVCYLLSAYDMDKQAPRDFALHEFLGPETPTLAAPDPESGWAWYAGENDEVFTVGPCVTREEAINEAVALGLCQRGDGSHLVYITEGKKDPLRISQFCLPEELITYAEETFADNDLAHENDDDVFSCTKEQEDDLKARLERACDDWQAAHGLTFTSHCFTGARNISTEIIPGG